MSRWSGSTFAIRTRRSTFYVEKLGFRVHTDVRNGDYRWLTVQHPDQPSFQLGLFAPGPPALDAGHGPGAARARRQGRHAAAGAARSTTAAPPTSACAPAGVEFTQEPIERYGSVDAGFRDPSGNGWKMIQARGGQ
ncbi:MAG: VOC family protein [Gemmatimonadales bacterium]